jgi:hypothetical protein
MRLEDLSKEQLIGIIGDLIGESSPQKYLDDIEKAEESNFRNEAFMESHGSIDYGYGKGVYGAL